MKINIHSHVIPPELTGLAGSYGPEIYADQTGTLVIEFGGSRFVADRASRSDEDALAQYSDPRLRIQEMDEAGIDIMGVTATPLLYLYHVERDIATKFTSAYNDALARYCSHDLSRLFFMSILPLQDIDRAVAEAERSLGSLGARGINIGATDLAGRDLDDEELWPVYQTAIDYGVPIFVHPAPTAFVTGTHDRHRESIILGYPYQEAVAFLHLVLGGVFDEFPDLKVYLTHGGGFVPYQLGRIEALASVASDRRCKQEVRRYLHNFVFDILIHDVKARQLAVDIMGADRLVVGDNYQGMDSADGFAYLDELALLPEDDERIRWRNAAELFKLSPRS